MLNSNEKNSKKKYNLLFISTDFNYFIDNNASFHKMYYNLKYFYDHKDFNVIVLQPERERDKEYKKLKDGIKCYYFREISFLKTNFVPFIDFNPFFILKIRQVLKKHQIHLIHVDFVYGINCLRLITKIPISYNAHNVESVYHQQVGKFYYRIPKVLRYFYTKYIDLLEKCAIKLVKNVNAVSHIDKLKFIQIFHIPMEKVIVNSIGFKREIFNYPIKKNLAREKLKVDRHKFIIGFHGSYFVNYANIEAIEFIKNKLIPQINDKEILFLIAGKMPSFKEKPSLRFLGYVNNLNEFLYSLDIAVVPIFQGSGIKTKIIDYLSASIPIITTKMGAEGLRINNGVHCFITQDHVKDIIEKIYYLKNNPDKIKKMKINIRELYHNHYNWDNILKKVAEKYKHIIEASKNY